MCEKTHVVLCVLEGVVPDGRVYTELETHELAIIVEAVDDWLDGICRTLRDLEGEEAVFHEKYMKEVTTTLEKIRDFEIEKDLEK